MVRLASGRSKEKKTDKYLGGVSILEKIQSHLRLEFDVLFQVDSSSIASMDQKARQRPFRSRAQEMKAHAATAQINIQTGRQLEKHQKKDRESQEEVQSRCIGIST